MAKKFLDLEVKNSARQLRIDVSPNDIKKGKKLDPTSCAVAQCLLRTTNADEVRVHRGVCLPQNRQGLAEVHHFVCCPDGDHHLRSWRYLHARRVRPAASAAEHARAEEEISQSSKGTRS